jgi:DNA topoisomerase VI subunit A
MLPSAATAHEARGFSVGGDRMHWMGMRTKHIEDLRRRQLDESHFQPFSENDAKHANALLRSPKLDELPDEFRNEVECMLEMRCKVELESLYALGLEVCSEWVQNSLQDLDWI